MVPGAVCRAVFNSATSGYALEGVTMKKWIDAMAYAVAFWAVLMLQGCFLDTWFSDDDDDRDKQTQQEPVRYLKK
jgi:hypothetical protein